MKVGDVVVAIHPHVLACGSGRYRCAIVANLDPFALVSVEGDMLWMREDPNNVLELCQAAPEIVAVAVERYRKDMGLTSTPRYPGLNPEGLSDDILAMMPAGARLLEC